MIYSMQNEALSLARLSENSFSGKIFFENENQEIKETIFTEEMLNFLTT
jgi:hypothetical protein